MASRASPVRDARRLAGWVVADLGRELRAARFRVNMTQRQVATAISRSASHISRIEGGKVKNLSILELTLVAAVVGLRLYTNLFPSERRPLDHVQLGMLNEFNERIHPSWHREMEKVMPEAGDMRAVDELISVDGCSCAVEAISRLADLQGHVRPANRKRRDVGADRLIFLVKATHHNRAILRDAGEIVRTTFPVDTRAAMTALAAGRDPGGDCLVLI